MRCLDHTDMVVLTGAIAVIASAAFFFAYLGLEQEPMVPPAPLSSSELLQAELSKSIEEATVTPALSAEERARTQVVLGAAIVNLARVKERETMFLSRLAAEATAAGQARQEFLERTFKLPADWRETEFAKRHRDAEAIAQQELGRKIVMGTLALSAEIGSAEESYGRALLAASQALEREAIEPGASEATIVAAARAATDLAARTTPAPAPAITRDPSWGFGSIGDGSVIPMLVVGAGAWLLLTAGIGLTENRLATHTIEAYCETAGKDVEVTVLVSDDSPYEVVNCSAFNGGAISCEKHCLKWPASCAA